MDESLHCRGFGKLGKYMVQHALDRGYEVVGVCRSAAFQTRRVQRAHHSHSWATNDREVIQKAVAGCDGVLTVLVPWGRTSTRREQPRRCSTTRVRARA